MAWSAAVAGDPGHVVRVSPAAGTLTSADPAATIRITVSGSVQCGLGTTARCPTVTVSPGGVTFAVRTGWVLPFLSGRGSRPDARTARRVCHWPGTRQPRAGSPGSP